MTEAVSFVVRLPARPGAIGELKSRLLALARTMAHEPDFVNTWLHHPMDDPDTIVIYETWACSLDHFMQHHATRPYRAEYEAALPGLLREPRTAQVLVPYQEVSRAHAGSAGPGCG